MFPVAVDEPLRANYLALCIQPHEGFHQRFEVKIPGQQIAKQPVDIEFHTMKRFLLTASRRRMRPCC